MAMFPLVRRMHLVRMMLMLACALLPVLAAQATQESGALSLADAVRMAADRAPRVDAGQFRVEAAQQDAIRAGRLPDPTLVAGINNLPITGSQAFNAAAGIMTMREIGVKQVIPSHAKRAAQKQVAGTGVQLAHANATVLRLRSKRAAANAWVALWAADKERSLLQELRDQAKLAVKLSKARLAGGTGTASAALATRADAQTLANRIDAANADVAAAHAGLERWLGRAADRALDESPDFSRLRVPKARLLAGLDRQGPLLVWTARKEQANASLALAKADKHPDWSVSLMYGQRIHRSDMIGIQVGVSLPLFAGNRQDRDISARFADRDAVRADYRDARRAQRQAIVQGVAIWQGWNRQIRRYRKTLLPLAADRSHIALAQYRGGGSLEPWLEARRDEIRTRVQYAQALAAWGKAWVALAYVLPDQNLLELPQ